MITTTPNLLGPMNRTSQKIAAPDRAAAAVPGKRAKAFTLIELLVVVSIIALLISILLPSLKSARDQAKLVKCMGNQRGLAQAAFIFSNDNKGRMQLSTSQAGMSGLGGADPQKNKYAYDSIGEIYAWTTALAIASGFKDIDYNWKWGVRADSYSAALAIQNRINDTFEIGLCPSDTIRIASPYYPRGDSLLGSGDPNFPQSGGGNMSYWGRLSYGINEDIVGNEITDGSNPAVWKDGHRGELDPLAGPRLRGVIERIYDPATVLLFIDAGADSTDTIDDSEKFANLITSAKAVDPFLADFVLQWPERIPDNRHPGGRYGVVFADFHGDQTKVVDRFKTGGSAGVPSKFSGTVRVSPYAPIGTKP